MRKWMTSNGRAACAPAVKNKGDPVKRLRRVLLAGVLCASQLCGCSSAPAQPSGPGQTTQTLRFIVGDGLGADMLAAADAFADRVARVSGGSLTIDVRTGRAEFGALARGDAELMLLRNTQLARTNSLFSMFTLPFLYDDNRHMSLALNAQDVRAYVNEAIAPQGVSVLTALYTGGLFFVSDASEMRTPDDFRDLPIAMRTDSADKLALLGALGAQVVPYSRNAIPAAFDTQTQYLPPGGQTTPWTVTIGTVELEASQLAQIGADPNTLYLIKSFHTCSPLWLTANTGAVNRLGSYEQAVLAEACAGLLAELEERFIAAEQAAVDASEREGMLLVEPERAQIAAALYDGTAERAVALPAYFDRRLYDLIESYATLS